MNSDYSTTSKVIHTSTQYISIIHHLMSSYMTRSNSSDSSDT